MGGDQGAGTRRQRREAEDAAERDRAGAAGAAARLPDRHPRGVGRLRLERAPATSSAKIQEEVDELREVDRGAEHRSISARAEEEMGDLLFAIANLSRKLGIEPETALRKANDKFTQTLRRAWSRRSPRRGGR